jgi:hypothetical protein
MLSLLLIASVSAAPAPTEDGPRTTAAEPARAFVRVIKGAEIRFGEAMRFEESVRRETIVRERDGSVRSASLIEFY